MHIQKKILGMVFSLFSGVALSNTTIPIKNPATTSTHTSETKQLTKQLKYLVGSAHVKVVKPNQSVAVIKGGGVGC